MDIEVLHSEGAAAKRAAAIIAEEVRRYETFGTSTPIKRLQREFGFEPDRRAEFTVISV